MYFLFLGTQGICKTVYTRMYKAGGHDSLHRRLESESILVRFEFVKKSVVNSPKVLFIFADIPHRSRYYLFIHFKLGKCGKATTKY